MAVLTPSGVVFPDNRDNNLGIGETNSPDLDNDVVTIITAPHSLCRGDIPSRHCDEISETAARSLYNKIDTDTAIFLADQFRGDIDLNRPISRDTGYRQEVTDLMREINQKKQLGFLIDVHSFPDEEHGDVAISILDNTPGTAYSLTLAYMLDQAGIPSNYRRGQIPVSLVKGNDLVNEARSRGLFAVLIEYSEKLDRDTIDQINDIIHSWLKVEIDVRRKELETSQALFERPTFHELPSVPPTTSLFRKPVHSRIEALDPQTLPSEESKEMGRVTLIPISLPQTEVEPIQFQVKPTTTRQDRPREGLVLGQSALESSPSVMVHLPPSPSQIGPNVPWMLNDVQ